MLRVVRNALVGYVQQAGGRMAAALAFYSIVLSGPVLMLTLALGSTLFGEEVAKQAINELLQEILPPSAGGGPELAKDVISTSRPTFTLALLAGVACFFAFTRALTTSLNVTLRAEKAEPVKRTLWVGPLLTIALIGLLFAAWAFKPAVQMFQHSTGFATSGLPELLLVIAAPLVVVMVLFAIILRIVPHVRLAMREVLIAAVVGAVLWEAARHLFSWLVGPDSPYIQAFGQLGGIMALFAWVYLSSVILVLTGQFAWAYAMESRGEGQLAHSAPRQAGTDGRERSVNAEHAVNEDRG